MVKNLFGSSLSKATILIFTLLFTGFFLVSCGESGKVSELEKKATDLEAQVAKLQEENANLKKAAPSAGKTLDAVRARGNLLVGVNGGVFGFSMPDDKGVWKGLDVDTARGIAAAVFGDADKVEFKALTAVQRLPALQAKEIDVLCRNTTQTLTRETVNGLNFVQVNFYDGQGFLVPKKLGIKSAKELGGATVCVLPGTTTEMNAADFFRANNMQWKPVVIEQTAELNKAFFCRPL